MNDLTFQLITHIEKCIKRAFDGDYVVFKLVMVFKLSSFALDDFVVGSIWFLFLYRMN